jgi:hypothetical protein
VALDTDLKKFAVISWDNIYDPGIPIGAGTIDQQDQQILIWGVPDVLWSEAVAGQQYKGFIGKNVGRIGRLG